MIFSLPFIEGLLVLSSLFCSAFAGPSPSTSIGSSVAVATLEAEAVLSSGSGFE
eukprot:CAMPEP_0116107786 /NCGR_PEP_ID=MMETSP0327-20121206/16417_1 /TAXON_ID=44447 /ORGANISM="Pseudo-nitzschia delicatissima, Strain B596" /LENGTH=53 /DNA_ID=CAMNT_0003600613 /DNA_START=135 /DNA_END=296 /DNA_ORIENTATION=+